MNRFRSAMVACVLAGAVLCPAVARATGPTLVPAPIVTETFDSASMPGMVLTPFQLNGLTSAAQWGRVTQSRHGSTGSGFWCAGSAGWNVLYPSYTGSYATWDLAPLANYYSSTLNLWYAEPTVGAPDEDGFVVRWSTDGAPSYQAIYGPSDLPLTSSWSQRSWDVSNISNTRNMSRHGGSLQIQFLNREPGAVTGPPTGQGPTVDDLSVTGYKYGPVRDLAVSVVGGSPHLTWDAPLSSTYSGATEDTRAIGYRVFRAPDTTPYVWTEVTGARVAGTSFDDPMTVASDGTYRYVVQAWDTGSGGGYGQVALPGDSATQFLLATRYTLSYSAAAHGSIAGSSTQVVIAGAGGTAVTATPATGYHFAAWSDGVATATRTDTNVTDDKSVTASFAINTYTLSYSAGAHGSIAGSSTQIVDHGSPGTAVTATPATGYHFAAWSDGVPTATRTDSNVTADKSVTASFAINTYSVTPSAGSHGSISPSGVRTVDWGGSVSFTIAADTGYHVADVLVDGDSVGAVSSYGFTGVVSDRTISATFEANPPDTFALSYAAGVGGSIVGSSTQVVVSGASGTAVTATPVTGYHFVSWSDGVPTATRTDANVLADMGVSATFAVDTHTLRYIAGTHGSIVGSATQIVAYGSSGTDVTAAPASGYHFVSWSDGGLTAARADTDVIADKTLTASFAINPPFAETLSISSSVTSVKRYKHFTLSGYLYRGFSGDKVYLKYQKPGSSTWYSITRTATAATGTRGKWSYSFYAAKKGTYTFKAYFAGTSARSKVTSRTIKVVCK